MSHQRVLVYGITCLTVGWLGGSAAVAFALPVFVCIGIQGVLMFVAAWCADRIVRRP